MINIYGSGQVAAKFLLNNPDEKIAAIIDGQKERKALFLGQEITNVNDAEKDLREYYTVVAVQEWFYSEIKEELERKYGLQEFEHFEYYKTYKKKKAFIYGNCHTAPIRMALEKNEGFSEKFGIYPLPLVHELYANDQVLDGTILQYCDLFIHQCIREENFYGGGTRRHD